MLEKEKGEITQRKTQSTTATRTDVHEVVNRPGRETTKATGIILALLLTMSVSSCQSEQDRQDEAMREELHNAIGVIETTQQGHLAALRENAELHEKHQLKASGLNRRTPAEKAGEELIRVAKESGNLGEKTGMERRSLNRT